MKICLIFKTSELFIFLSAFFIFITSCVNKPATTPGNSGALYGPDTFTNTKGYYTEKSNGPYTPDEYNNTKGYWENGEIITRFDCPDDISFPPVEIKCWDKIPVVNGRFPTYAETKNGASLHHYGEKENALVKPYHMILPKLAYHINANKRSEFEIRHDIGKLKLAADLVVVIQIVQTAKDTIVGYRYLTGGCGGSLFRDFHFLTDDEVKKVTEQYGQIP